MIVPTAPLKKDPLREVRSIKEQSHEATRKSTSNRDSHDPGEYQKTNTLPIDSLGGAIAEADTDGGTGDTHGRRDGKGELREEEDSDGGTHFHGRTTAR